MADVTVVVPVAVCHYRQSFVGCPAVNVVGPAAEGCCCFWRPVTEWTLHLFALAVEPVRVVVGPVVAAELVTVDFVFIHIREENSTLLIN